jgi:alpha-glucosidase
VANKPATPPAIPGQAAGPTVPLQTDVHPTLDALPVYVRGGAILPMAALTQSTSETPSGPLTLRVYAGPDCRGSVYLDDGETLGYERGQWMRESFACERTADGLRLTVAKREGDFPAWWTRLRLEIFGWSALKGTAAVNGRETPAVLHTEGNVLSVEVPDDGSGATVVLQ